MTDGLGNSSRNKKVSNVHHANIRDKERTIRRLRSAFRKVNIKLITEQNNREFTAIAVLTEIKPNGLGLFSKQKLKKKSTVSIKIAQPLAITIRGIVRYCERVENNSVVNMKKADSTHRLYIEFIMSSETERLALLDLYNKIRDENYVATQWHIYVTEKMQFEQRIKSQTEKLNAVVEDQQAEKSDSTDDSSAAPKKKAA